jgi:hypothetical protein
MARSGPLLTEAQWKKIAPLLPKPPKQPPSTSSPCPAWLFRLRSPFSRRSETAVQKRFAPFQLLALV